MSDGIKISDPGSINAGGSVNVAGAVVAGNVIVTDTRNIDVGSDLVAREIHGHIGPYQKTLTQEQAFDRIAAAVKLNLTQIQENIQQARKDSSQFFRLTLVFASLGFIIVLGGVVLLYLGEISAGIVAAVSSSVPQITAVLFFQKDKELRNTLEEYHGHMLGSQKLMTMIDVAETIRNPAEQDKMKQQIIFSTLGIAG